MAKESSKVFPVTLTGGLVLFGAGCALLAAGHGQAAFAALRWVGLAALAYAGIQRRSLTFWIFFAMFVGLEIGLDWPGFAAHLRVLSDIFLRLIKVIVAPLILGTLVTGIAGHGDLKKVGRIGLKSLIYFEVVTTIALFIGVGAINLTRAGEGLALPAASTEQGPQNVAPLKWDDFLLHVFPENIVKAVGENQILQVAIFSILFGAALAMLPDQKRAPLVTVLQSLADVMFQLTRFIMYLAPLAAGAAIAYTVGNTGLGTLLPLAKLVGTYYIALTAFVLLVMVPVLMVFRVPLRGFLRAVGEPAAIGFATTTSEAALPLAMERMEEFGVPRWIVSFVIPTGYSFNMTGGSVYLSMAAVFVAQAAGIHLTFGRELAVVLVLMAASKGIAGVPRASLVVLLATASAVHLPTAPILLILGVDTLMDMGRTMMNVVGNCMAAAVIGKTEGAG